MKRRTLAIVIALLAGSTSPVLAQSPAPAQPPPKKIVVKTESELPAYTYQIEGSPSEFILTDAPFKAFANELRKNAEETLARFDIQDPTYLKTYYQTLLQVAVFEGRFDDAPALIEKMRELETKESAKLMTGVSVSSYMAAKKKAGNDAAALAEAFRAELKSRLSTLPWEKVAEEIKSAKGRADLVTRDLLIGSVKGSVDPAINQLKGKMSEGVARGLLTVRVSLDTVVPLQRVASEVYGEIISKNANIERKDIWSDRLVTLPADAKASPVVMCVWDSGVDTSVFKPSALWTNPKETVNGKDDDGNGFIDDVHGIAFDIDAKPVPNLLLSTKELKSDPKVVTSHMKGVLDLQANIQSPEADALRKYIQSLPQDKVTGFIEDLGLFGNYSHGTHVAGIADAGNPFVKLLPVRIEFDFHAIPRKAPSIEDAKAQAKAAKDSVAYMKAAGVRVTNMSWGGSRKDIENDLEKTGVGGSAEERAKLAGEIFKIMRDGLDEAIKSAPEILFIAAAGNSDNDNDFSEMIPSGLTAPNLITIGAVDSSGKPTGFTTFGKNVKLYANGFEVESYIPGGQRMKFSGTSMAAPNVANLAGKILALNPNLGPSELIDMMARTSDPMEGYAGRSIINPKKAVESLPKK